MIPVRRLLPMVVVAAVLVTACSGADSPTPASSPGGSALQISTVATGLDVPWGLGFLPDGTAVVTERNSAAIKTVTSAGTVTTVGTVSGVRAAGEGGLLGVAVSPGFAADHLLYAYYTADEGNRIDTVLLHDGALRDQRGWFSGIPKGPIHNGGRLAFGPDGLLYVGTGETGDRAYSQDTASLGGKILRLAPDLAPVLGNPLVGSASGGDADAAPRLYSWGHRNVQGIAFDDKGRLWASEFGQNTWDELNLITAGGNYGWPVVEGPGAHDGFVQPQRVWPTSEASPSGIAFWHGSIWMAGLRGERLWQIPIAESGGTAEPIAHLAGDYGRLRSVAGAPDGSLWLTTSNTDGRGDVRDGDDRILRLTSAG